MAKLWVNGHILDSADNTLSVLDRGFTLADGAFETMYFDNNCVEYYEYHILRFRNTLTQLSITYHVNEEVLLNNIRETMKANDLRSGAVRVTITRGVGGRGLACPKTQAPTIVITVSSVQRLRQPARMGISQYTRNETSPLSTMKTLSYTGSIMALDEVSREGHNEALILNTKGKVCCSSAGNIFLVLGQNLVTPDLNQGCLAGIMRAMTIACAKRLGIFVSEAPVSIEDIKNADAVFITNSLMRIRMVGTLEDTLYDLDNQIVSSIKNTLEVK